MPISTFAKFKTFPYISHSHMIRFGESDISTFFAQGPSESRYSPRQHVSPIPWKYIPPKNAHTAASPLLFSFDAEAGNRYLLLSYSSSFLRKASLLCKKSPFSPVPSPSFTCKDKKGGGGRVVRRYFDTALSTNQPTIQPRYLSDYTLRRKG